MPVPPVTPFSVPPGTRRTCHTEGQIYRHQQCTRFALGKDLTHELM
jgi:hypothetical protein